MSTDEEFEAELGAVFDDLVNLIGETKQAAWTASSSERRQTFDNLKLYLAEQAAAIADYEQLRSSQVSTFTAGTLAELATTVLVKARVARDWTQRQLADALRVAELKIQRYEANGYRSTSLARRCDIADALGVQVEPRAELKRSAAYNLPCHPSHQRDEAIRGVASTRQSRRPDLQAQRRAAMYQTRTTPAGNSGEQRALDAVLHGVKTTERSPARWPVSAQLEPGSPGRPGTSLPCTRPPPAAHLTSDQRPRWALMRPSRSARTRAS